MTTKIRRKQQSFSTWRVGDEVTQGFNRGDPKRGLSALSFPSAAIDRDQLSSFLASWHWEMYGVME